MTEPDDSDDAGDVLDATATARVTDDGALVVTLTVANPAGGPVECSFRDGQRIEVVAERDDDDDDDGGECWRYSDGQMFSMATGSETVPGGGELSFDAAWPDPDPGDYRVRAWLVATDATAEAAVEVAVD